MTAGDREDGLQPQLRVLRPDLPEGWQDDAADKLHRLEFYADRELARRADLAKKIGPHTLRLAFITAAPVTSATRPVWGSEALLAGMGLPLCDCGPIDAYEATAGLSTSSHHWRKLVGVEFSGVRWTPLSRPSFVAQAMSAYP
jgi:hypothetical protein